MNKKTRALTEEQYINIIQTLQNGFIGEDGHMVKPNRRVAAVLVLEANLGIRISDVLRLRVEGIVKDGSRYRLDIVEQKTQKKSNVIQLRLFSRLKYYRVLLIHDYFSDSNICKLINGGKYIGNIGCIRSAIMKLTSCFKKFEKK